MKNVHECDDGQVDMEEEEYEDEEQYDVYLQDDGQSGDDYQDDEDGEEDEMEDAEEDEFLETFMAAWRAKKKTSEHRLSRGFTNPKGKGKSSTGSGSSSKNGDAPSTATTSDTRKASSRCAECKQLGHWKGDPECPNVKQGKTPRYKEKPKVDKKPNAVHWIAMVNIEDKRLARIVDETTTSDADTVRVRFASNRMVKYVMKRLDRGSEIFFGSKSSGSIIVRYDTVEGCEDELVLNVERNKTGHWSRGALEGVLNQIVGPIARDEEEAKASSARARAGE
jgi:hypothetical protein